MPFPGESAMIEYDGTEYKWLGPEDAPVLVSPELHESPGWQETLAKLPWSIEHVGDWRNEVMIYRRKTA